MPPDTKSGLRRTRNARFAGFTKRADRARCPRRHCYPTLSADGSSSRPCQSSPRWSVRMVSCLFVRRGGGVSCPGAAKKPEWAAETRRHRRDSSVAHRAKEEVSSLVAASPSRIGNADPSLRRGSWSRVAQLHPQAPNMGESRAIGRRSGSGAEPQLPIIYIFYTSTRPKYTLPLST